MPTPVPTPPEPATPRALPRLARWALLALAALSLVLAVIGVVLPGLPTTPFVLLAAWAAARSSPRLHAWLRANRLFGPMLRDWENGRTVSRRAKWSATFAMAFCAVVIAFTAHRAWLAGVGIGSMALVLAWLWRRPERLTGREGLTGR